MNTCFTIASGSYSSSVNGGRAVACFLCCCVELKLLDILRRRRLLLCGISLAAAILSNCSLDVFEVVLLSSVGVGDTDDITGDDSTEKGRHIIAKYRCILPISFGLVEEHCHDDNDEGAV